ncbi:MAG: histidine phosphatase family protein [Actinomycetota bacterium]
MTPGRALVLIRHAMPIIDRQVPSNRWSLSDEGRRNAETLARRLDLPGDTLVVSSDELKARQTAEAVSQSFAVDPRLAEVSRPWVENEYEITARWWLQGEDVAGWEPRASVVRRTTEALGEATTRTGSTVCVVSHGLAISTLVGEVTGADPVEFWAQLQFPDSVIFDLRSFSSASSERGAE